LSKKKRHVQSINIENSQRASSSVSRGGDVFDYLVAVQIASYKIQSLRVENFLEGIKARNNAGFEFKFSPKKRSDL